MLQLHGVSKSFGTTQALQPTDLTIEHGRTTVLIGPSGCGKSTLLRLMSGLVAADSGSIEFDGQPLASSDILSLRRRLGYVIQEGGLFPHLTARRNVTLMARYLGWPRERMEVRLADLCELTQFPRDGLDRFPAQLSGGQRQRVSLMRALMLDPDLLLLDEPLGALDPMIRYELQGDLRAIFAKLRRTVVVVTHDLSEAGYLGDVLILLRGGRVVQCGTLDELVRRPADPFVERFVSAQRGLVLDQSGSPPA